MIEHAAIWLGVAGFTLLGIGAWIMAGRSMLRTPVDLLGPNREVAERLRRERVLANFGFVCLLFGMLLSLLCLVPHVH